MSSYTYRMSGQQERPRCDCTSPAACIHVQCLFVLLLVTATRSVEVRRRIGRHREPRLVKDLQHLLGYMAQGQTARQHLAQVP